MECLAKSPRAAAVGQWIFSATSKSAFIRVGLGGHRRRTTARRMIPPIAAGQATWLAIERRGCVKGSVVEGAALVTGFMRPASKPVEESPFRRRFLHSAHSTSHSTSRSSFPCSHLFSSRPPSPSPVRRTSLLSLHDKSRSRSRSSEAVNLLRRRAELGETTPPTVATPIPRSQKDSSQTRLVSDCSLPVPSNEGGHHPPTLSAIKPMTSERAW